APSSGLVARPECAGVQTHAGHRWIPAGKQRAPTSSLRPVARTDELPRHCLAIAPAHLVLPSPPPGADCYPSTGTVRCRRLACLRQLWISRLSTGILGFRGPFPFAVPQPRLSAPAPSWSTERQPSSRPSEGRVAPCSRRKNRTA